VLAWVAFVPLLVALDDAASAARPYRTAWSTGYLFGVAFFLVSVHWIARLSDVAITVPWLKYPAWVAAALYLAIFPGIASSLTVFLARRSGAGIAASFVPSWLAVEVARGSGELGFPWFQPGYTQSGLVPILQLASLGGVTLVTAWVLLTNVLVWRALRPRRASGRGLFLAAAALSIALPWLWGNKVLAAAAKAEGPRPTIALVQGNIAGEIKWSGQHQREILDRFLELSRQALSHAPRPALIVWPETATGSYLRRQIDQTLQVARFAHDERVALFSGFADYRIDSIGVTRYFNAAGIFYANGAPGAIYAKRHLVPFGERMPFQWLFPQLGRIELGQAEWTPGSGSVLFPERGAPSDLPRFGCLICFESIFPDLSRDDVVRGARWLLNVTNDEWFGNSAAIGQHAGMAVFRAVENHVPLARCANTGLTLIVDAYGRVVARLPLLEPGVLAAELPPPGRPTFYTRLGDWPGVLAWILVAALAWPRRRRS
jgi:apolipoprotein N-acyltransferase